MFVVFEGIDGAGKSTLMTGLKKVLEERGIDFIVTREPGGTALGEEIRQMLLRCQGETPKPRTELLLYEAGRAQHVDHVIGPALKNKKWVLCDRYSASSIAFQCGGRGLNKAEVDWLNKFATNDLKPDLYVLLDLSVEESERRRSGRDADRFEKEEAAFHQRVRDNYLAQAKEDPARWLVLDASASSEESLRNLLQAMEKKKWM
jgi:dTMP kinase